MIVYKKYNQEQLDLQYNNRYHVPDFENHLQQWESLSRLAEEKYTVIKDIFYGHHSRECLDIFPSSEPGAATLVFMHGGYWQKFDKSSFHFIAGAFARYGITTVVINYPLIPAVTMDEVVQSCNKAIDWLHNYISKWNGDPEKIYVAGHSAGAHLAVMLVTGEEKQGDQNPIKGVCAISGLFDLLPIQLSNINDVLQIDKETAIRNSPVSKDPNPHCHLLITAGAKETDEFRHQSEQLYNKWKNTSRNIEFIEIPELNHFSILTSVHDQNSLLHQSLLQMIC